MPTTRHGYSSSAHGNIESPLPVEPDATDPIKRTLPLADAGFPGVEIDRRIKPPLHTKLTTVDL
jgi:hypothetical protein